MRKFLFLFITFLLSVSIGYSQEDTLRRTDIIVQNANSQIIDTRVDTVLYLNGDVVLIHDSLYMYCDTAKLVGNDVYAYGNVSVLKSDSLRIFSDSIKYYGDSLMAYFYHNVVLEEGNHQLFTEYLVYNIATDVGTYTDTALLKSTENELTSRRGIYYAKAKMVDFYEDVYVTGDDFSLVTDSLRYFTDANLARFLAPTRIKNKEQEIYSHYGYFDLDDNDAQFYGNAQFKDPERKASADTITYEGTKEIVNFFGNAYLETDEEKGSADHIIYERESEILILDGNSLFVSDDQNVEGRKITYNGKTEQVKIAGKGFLSKPPYLIHGEDFDYDKLTGESYIDGDVIIRDTSENFTLVGDHVIFNNEEKNIKAFNDAGKPYIETIMGEADTMYISGDTLHSFRQYNVIDSLTMDTTQNFKAFNHVEILGSAISGLADSLYFDGLDSIFTLYNSPVLWSDSTQFSGDTIMIGLSNNKIDAVKLRSSSMIINTMDFRFFNQLSGVNADIVFFQDTIQYMDLKSNVNTVYYMLDDDDAYIGVNQASSQDMSIYFIDNKIDRIKYLIGFKSELLPMKGTNHDNLRLKQFKWLYNERPKIFDDIIK